MKAIATTIICMGVFIGPIKAEEIKMETPKVKTFSLKPPKYSIKPSLKHANKRKQKALKWYIDHVGRETLD